MGPTWTVAPDPLDGLTTEDRLTVIDELAIQSETVFQESHDKLVAILSKYDPLLLLSILASYALTAPVSEDAGVTKLDSEFEIYPPHIELLQAFALQLVESEIGQDVFGPDVVQSAWDALKDLTESLQLKGFDSGIAKLSNEQKSVALAQGFMRTKTRMVRNWGHFSQVKRISRNLYSSFDDYVVKQRGFGISQVIDVFETLFSEVEERQSERFRQIRKLFLAAGKDKFLLVEKYHELIGSTEEKAKEFITEIGVANLTLEAVQSMVLSHYDLRLPELFTFELTKLKEKLPLTTQQVSDILDEYSMVWGALETYETGHFYLSNPVWTKPVIKNGDARYFCFLPGTLFSFIIPCLENLLSGSESAISDRRAQYLENRVTEIVESRFPSAKTLQNLKWNDGETVYETDIVTFIDSFALIIECKSGKISAPALRGAPDRLKKHIQELLIEPNIQSLRLKNLFDLLHSNPELDDPVRKTLPQDLADVRSVIRVSVCLEDFGVIQSSLKHLEGTNWLPQDFEPCPTMNLADFEVVFDLLDHPVQILHYLSRRAELEGAIGYLADELDLLGLYISTLFNIGNVRGNNFLDLTGMSAPIDKFYNSLDAGVELKKPKPKIKPLFSAVFSQLENRALDRWTEIGFALNMFSPDDQDKFIQFLPKIEKNVRRKWKEEGHENMLIYSPPKASHYALAYVMFKDQNEDRRIEFIEHAAALALEPSHVKHVVVIGKNIDRNDVAYHTICLAE